VQDLPFPASSNADNDLKYRTQEEIDEWRRRDPIKLLESYLLEHALITAEDVAGFAQRIAVEVDEARYGRPARAGVDLDHLYG
jgi:pyruvate dehydrogenase E1 component alpha subunit